MKLVARIRRFRKGLLRHQRMYALMEKMQARGKAMLRDGCTRREMGWLQRNSARIFKLSNEMLGADAPTPSVPPASGNPKRIRVG